jgi:GTP-binding protein YchF
MAWYRYRTAGWTTSRVYTHPQKFTPATIEFVDIAGLVKGASKGEGLGNKFLSHIREVDAVIEVVRCFEDGNITHVDGSIDPLRDVTTINYELIFADMETVEKRRARSEKMIKTGDKKYAAEVAVCDKMIAGLEKGDFVRNMDLDEDEREIAAEMFLLTDKPVIYVANISEDQVGAAPPENAKAFLDYAKAHGSDVISISAKVEEEAVGAGRRGKGAVHRRTGHRGIGAVQAHKGVVHAAGADKLPYGGRKGSARMDYKKGNESAAAAGKIHSDFERGLHTGGGHFLRPAQGAGREHAGRKGSGRDKAGGKGLRYTGRRRSAVPLQCLTAGPAAAMAGKYYHGKGCFVWGCGGRDIIRI